MILGGSYSGILAAIGQRLLQERQHFFSQQKNTVRRGLLSHQINEMAGTLHGNDGGRGPTQQVYFNTFQLLLELTSKFGKLLGGHDRRDLGAIASDQLGQPFMRERDYNLRQSLIRDDGSSVVPSQPQQSSRPHAVR